MALVQYYLCLTPDNTIMRLGKILIAWRMAVFTILLFFSTITSAQNWNEVIKAVASDRGAGDQFGVSVAIDGDYAVVGASDKDILSGGTTLNGAGSAYIFKRSNGSWIQQQKLVASDPATGDDFGFSVDISGEYVIIGARLEDHDAAGGNQQGGAGSAYIFKRSGNTWSQQQKIIASDRQSSDYFGYSVSISNDYIVVGAYGKDRPRPRATALRDVGAAYIFKRTGSSWSQEQKILPGDINSRDHFGYSVSIDGDYVIVGSRYESHNAAATGGYAFRAGSAYIFKRNGSTWNQQQKIVASDRTSRDAFGYSVNINGEYAIVGAPWEDEDASGGNNMRSSGSAYVFKRTGSIWSQQQKIVASDRGTNDWFGCSVDISANWAVVGGRLEDEDTSNGNTLIDAGSAYIFKRTGSTWSQHQKIVASDRSGSDDFGYSVAINGDDILIGSRIDGEDVTGGNTLSWAGSVYFFSSAPLCTGNNTLPTLADSTYTGSYATTDANGWTNYCAAGGELLLSLNIGSSGAVINANEVKLKLGSTQTISWIDSGGMIANDKGASILYRLWDVAPTTQPNTNTTVGVRYYFTNNEYLALKDTLMNHNGGDPNYITTLSSPTDLNIYKVRTTGSFLDPHSNGISGITLRNNHTPDTNSWKHATHGTHDHIAEFLVSSFSGGGGGAGGGGVFALPVELKHFTAELTSPGLVQLNWATASEVNNSHFEIERSTDGLYFKQIGEVKGTGNSKQIVNYRSVDNNLPLHGGNLFYRLKQVDFNGNATYSSAQMVRVLSSAKNKTGNISIFPNPALSELNVSWDWPEEKISLTLTDMSGKVVLHNTITSQKVKKINIEQLPKGLYFLSASNGSSNVVLKVLKE